MILSHHTDQILCFMDKKIKKRKQLYHQDFKFLQCTAKGLKIPSGKASYDIFTLSYLRYFVLSYTLFLPNFRS